MGDDFQCKHCLYGAMIYYDLQMNLWVLLVGSLAGNKIPPSLRPKLASAGNIFLPGFVVFSFCLYMIPAK